MNLAIAVKLQKGKRRRRPKRLPRKRLPDKQALAYFRILKALLGEARRLVDERLIALLPELVDHARLERGDSGELRVDRYGTLLIAIFDRIQSELSDLLGRPRVERLVTGLGEDVSEFQREQLNRQLSSALSVDVVAEEPDLGPIIEGFTTENVGLIRGLTDKYLRDIQQAVVAGVRDGRRAEEMAKDFQERFDISENRALLIARDQVGKLFGELDKVRQENLGITTFVWRSSNDNRVRPEHAARDGEVFSWSKSWPRGEGPPGYEINCRCTADPNVDEILSG